MFDVISSVIQQQFRVANASQITKPSTHAVAVWRAAHQLLEQPPIFTDPIALKILGNASADVTENLALHKDLLSTAMRVSVAVRSRFAEDERAEALQNGACQYVILGAGLDTYAYRNRNKEERVFEVDLPATQTMKTNRLKKMAIYPGCRVGYIACDFEQGELQAQLLAAGFNKHQKTFFSWLGVVPYLDAVAIKQTLAFIASCAPGSSLVFDYIVDPITLSDIEKMALDILAAQLAAGGEPLKSFFIADELVQTLTTMGFSQVDDISPVYLNERYLISRNDGLRMGNVTRLCKVVV